VNLRGPARSRAAQTLTLRAFVLQPGSAQDSGQEKPIMHSFDFGNIDFKNPVVLIGAVVLVLVIVAIFALIASHRRKRSEELRRRFGSEYDVAIKEHGARSRAEARLVDRVRRVERFKIRDLTATERERFLAQWQAIQTRFIDHPRGTAMEADELVNSVMQARGFPVADFNQRVEDLSVHHARLVDSYRSANAISARAGGNEATTEELRTAMIHYRSLFDDLLGVAPAMEAVEAPPTLRKTA
jgi:hypothetical protein